MWVPMLILIMKSKRGYLQLEPFLERVKFLGDIFGNGQKNIYTYIYRGAEKSLARPGRKQAALVKSVMGRGMD